MPHFFEKNRDFGTITKGALTGVLLFVSVVAAGFLFFADYALAGQICVRGNCLQSLNDLPVHSNFGFSLKYFRPATICDPHVGGGAYGPYCNGSSDFKEGLGGNVPAVGQYSKGYCQQDSKTPILGKLCATEYEPKITNTTGPLCLHGRCWGGIPKVIQFTVNGNGYVVGLDYCREKADLSWGTENADLVFLFGDRIEDRYKSAGTDLVNGYYNGLRPKRATIYEVIAKNAVGEYSPFASVPVIVFRSTCFEKCIIDAIEGAIPAARDKRANETQSRCVWIPLVGTQCTELASDTRLMLDGAELAMGFIDSKQPPPLRKAIVKIMGVVYYLALEMDKRGMNCSGLLPDEDFPVNEFLANIQNGFIKGLWHGMIFGVVDGLFGGLSLIQIQCSPEISQAINWFVDFTVNKIAHDILKLYQVGEPPNESAFGERIGYLVGDILGNEIGNELGGAIAGGINSFFNPQAGSVTNCINPTPPRGADCLPGSTDPKCVNPVLGPNGELFDPIETSRGILLVHPLKQGDIPALESVTDFKKAASLQVAVAETAARLEGTQSANLLHPSLLPEGKDIVVVKEGTTFGDMNPKTFSATVVTLMENTKTAWAKGGTISAAEAFANEFKYAMGRQKPPMDFLRIRKYIYANGIDGELSDFVKTAGACSIDVDRCPKK